MSLILESKHNSIITDEDLKDLSPLTELTITFDFEKYVRITDKSITALSNLVKLTLIGNSTITNKGLSCLTKLKKLMLQSDQMITDEGLINLTNLTELTLAGPTKITDIGIKYLTNLQTLDISQTYKNKISDKFLQELKDNNVKVVNRYNYYNILK
jgi:hypothetical protein